MEREDSSLKPGAVGVVIATYGDISVWGELAHRSIMSVERQTVLPEVVNWSHGDTLQEARNRGAAACDTEFLIFLDADDELDEGYVEAMLNSSGDIRRPATIGVYEDGSTDAAPVLIPVPEGGLTQSNYIVIGAMIRKQDFLNVGGFNDFPILEDWHLWLRLVRAGAQIVDVPGAIYRVHVRSDSRNTHSAATHGRYYTEIRAEFS